MLENRPIMLEEGLIMLAKRSVGDNGARRELAGAA